MFDVIVTHELCGNMLAHPTTQSVCLDKDKILRRNRYIASIIARWVREDCRTLSPRDISFVKLGPQRKHLITFEL